MRVHIIFFYFKIAFSYKFAIFNPLFAHSHTNFLGKIADTLTEAGHDVTQISPILDETLANKTGVTLTKKIVFIQQPPELKKSMEEHRKTNMKNLWTQETGPLAMFKLIKFGSSMVSLACKHIFNEKEIMEQMKREKFDVAIIEPFNMCGYAYAEEIGIPTTIGALSVVHKEFVSMLLGEPIASSYVPTITVPFSDKMTLTQRLKNTVAIWIGMKATSYIYQGEEEFLMKRQGDRFLGAAELVARSPVFFTNSNPYLNYPKPKIYKVVDIGGIVVDTKKEYKLEKKWNDVLNERPYTVYISFGTMAKSVDMPDEFKKGLFSVFGSLPNVTFIWKYEDPSQITDIPPNLYLESWLPQNALLADPRLSLFITHGGLGSTTEVAYFGRPSIMIPIFSEQPRNAKMLARHGGSLVLEKADLARPDSLKGTIMEVISNKKYSQAATHLAEMLKNAPISPKELVLRHSEFAARFGKMPQLDPYGRHLSFIQYHNLDVFIILFLLTLLLILFIIFAWKKATRWICSRKIKNE